MGSGEMSAIAHALASLPAWRIAIAALLTLGSYLALSGYELLALSYAGRRLPYRRVTLATWVTYGLGQSIGFPVLAGGAVRLRMYTKWGIGIGDIGRIVAFNAVTMWLGVITVLGFAFVSQNGVVAGVLSVAPAFIDAIGIAASICILAYLGFSV